MHDRDVMTLFQPIVHLPSGEIVGYEALCRGPDGSALASAGSLLAAANRAGRLAEFDWVARASACRAAMAADLDVDNILLLNIEPLALDSDCPADLWPDIERAFDRYRVVLEVTERSLDRDPATLMDGIERQRPHVDGIGLDDVGSEPATVAMLPVVAPDIIKIAREVVQAAPDEEVTRVLTAIHAEAERTDAMIVAEGVETDEHRHHALVQGALIGQGYLFGGPHALPSPAQRLRQRAPMRRSAPTWVATPFDALSSHVDVPASEELLLALTRQHAVYARGSLPTIYVSLLPGPQALEAVDLAHLAELARRGSFAAVLGPGVPAEPGRGVRGTGARHQPLPRDEWAAVAIGPYGCSAILARRAPDTDGEWTYGVTNDPGRVVAAARSLVRLLGAPEPRFRFEG